MLLLLVPLCVGYLVGRASTRHLKLPKNEQRELVELRRMYYSLLGKSAEHAMLGDHFAVIVNSELDTYRKRMEKK
jgi:hypothetical protein